MMTTRKTERATPVRRRPVQGDSDRPGKRDKDAEVVHARLQSTDEPLTLDDSDFGGDPYNTTGRFTTLKDD